MRLSDFQWLIIKGFVSDFPLMCKTNCVSPNHWIYRVPYNRHHHMHKVYDCEVPTHHWHRRLWHFIDESYCLPLQATRSARLSEDFAAQYSAYGFPCQRLTRHLTVLMPMTRGLGGVLTLPIRGLASGAASAGIFYRFISAHWVSLYIKT